MPLPYDRMSSSPASFLYFLYLSNALMVLMMLSLMSFGRTTFDMDTLGVYMYRVLQKCSEGRACLQVRRLHQLADFRVESHNFVQNAAVHIDIVVYEIQRGAVRPRGRSHLDDAVLHQRAALVEARATGNLRVKRVAKSG
jgi:hypothetical protein